MISLDTMRAGLAQGEFFLEYMPTVSLVDGRCTGAEALVRWNHESGVYSPDEFIPVAENTPLSGLITYWVIDTLAAEMGDWLRANPNAHISINVPPEILGRGGLEYAATKAGLMGPANRAGRNGNNPSRGGRSSRARVGTGDIADARLQGTDGRGREGRSESRTGLPGPHRHASDGCGDAQSKRPRISQVHSRPVSQDQSSVYEWLHG